ncbi:MAG: cytochrome c biogenesis protein CcsA [Phycisphaeraceae bacterium]|nr:cytochrome c biogenesis protein CcsA [Phycisphaeraceae bacterium]
MSTHAGLIRLYWALTAATFAATTAMVFLYTPVEATMGPVQKIFYIHLPCAINTFVACLVVFAASVAYLATRQSYWDDLAYAAAKLAVLFCAVVLLTGMLWARSAWGIWWTWSPRLTFSLLLWLLYVVYLVIRSAVESPSRRAVVCAVYGLIAFLDVPLIHLSTRLMPDIHPGSIHLDPTMKLTLGLFFVPVTMLNIGLLMAGLAINRKRRALTWTDEEDVEGQLKESVA